MRTPSHLRALRIYALSRQRAYSSIVIESDDIESRYLDEVFEIFQGLRLPVFVKPTDSHALEFLFKLKKDGYKLDEVEEINHPTESEWEKSYMVKISPPPFRIRLFCYNHDTHGNFNAP